MDLPREKAMSNGQEIFGFAFQDIKDALLTTLRTFVMNGKYYLFTGKGDEIVPISGVDQRYLHCLKERRLFQELTLLGHFGDQKLAKFLDTIFSFIEIQDELDLSQPVDYPRLGPCVATFAELIPVHHSKSKKHLEDACWKITLYAFNLAYLLQANAEIENNFFMAKALTEVLKKDKKGHPWHKVRLESIQKLEGAGKSLRSRHPLRFPKLPEDYESGEYYVWALEIAKAISPEKFDEVREKLFDFAYEALKKLGQKYKVEFEKLPNWKKRWDKLLKSGCGS